MKFKLKPEVKKLWVEALRSGDYKQTTCRLRSVDDRFCCLGVLCNIHAQQNPDFALTQRDRFVYDGEAGALSQRVIKWAFEKFPISMSGDVSVVYPRDKSGSTLTELNDYCDFNFSQIADVIQDQL